MSSSSTLSAVQFAFILLLLIIEGISGATLTLINRCNNVVWPGILANAGSNKLDTTGFQLQPGGSRSFQAPPGWSGRFWGRTGCNFDPTTGQGSCATGDCGSNQIECNGAGATPPATLAEFFIGGGTTGQDFYDVSLVDGYNLPMMVEASGGGTGSCAPTGCVKDVNRMCPKELRVGDGQACKSACGAFASPEYCCSGDYASPSVCKPSMYSQAFKSACPRAYSYAYDDATSTFTCTGADYTITFCPSTTSQKSLRDSSSMSGSSDGPPVATGTSNSGSEDDSNPFGWPWLPNFVTGDSSRTINPNILRCSTLMMIASLIAFLLQY